MKKPKKTEKTDKNEKTEKKRIWQVDSLLKNIVFQFFFQFLCFFFNSFGFGYEKLEKMEKLKKNKKPKKLETTEKTYLAGRYIL